MSKMLVGDALEVLATLPGESVQCCVTSPPYFGLRSYLSDGHPDKALEIGLESTPDEYVARLVAVFREVRRVLKDDGVCFVNLGDSYNSVGHKKSSSGYGTTGLAGGKAQEHHPLRRENNCPGLKHKDLIGIPWRVAFALQADEWWLRQDIIWSKPNPMPESVTDRCTKAHEYLFLLAKNERYYFDAKAIAEERADNRLSSGNKARAVGERNVGGRKDGFTRPGGDMVMGETRNRRSVWTIATTPCAEAHFAVMPEALVDPCILAGTKPGDVVLDPFFGSGTVGRVAERLGRDWIGIDLNPAYSAIQKRRTAQAAMVLT